MSFHDLHHQGVPFVLPNAWDVPSALAYLAEGFTAIGTTSFGVSSSGGHPDGHRATRGANIALAAALAPLQCYVSVDIEDGYSDEPDAIADYVAQLSTAGINIEDSSAEKLIDPALQPLKSLRSNNVTPRCSSTPASTPIGCASTPIPPARSSAHFATSMPAPTASLSHWPTIPTNLLSSLATFRARLTRCPCPA
ncbi:PEP phosphonomutase-like enzyme [Mycobacterium tuberculosis]|nr:PEP phosphonomutase-like enzyme [Mycobacterium tuberculosis]